MPGGWYVWAGWPNYGRWSSPATAGYTYPSPFISMLKDWTAH